MRASEQLPEVRPLAVAVLETIQRGPSSQRSNGVLWFKSGFASDAKYVVYRTILDRAAAEKQYFLSRVRSVIGCRGRLTGRRIAMLDEEKAMVSTMNSFRSGL